MKRKANARYCSPRLVLRKLLCSEVGLHDTTKQLILFSELWIRLSQGAVLNNVGLGNAVVARYKCSSVLTFALA